MADGLAEDLDLLLHAARAAGAAAMPWFNAGRETTARVTWKEGDSPVSEADHAANDALAAMLRQARPGYEWVSEETADALDRLSASHVFVVDPIDGTRAFIGGKRQWSVSAALVVDGEPAAGVIHAPALGVTYAARRGAGATRNGEPIRASDRRSLAGAAAAGPKPSLEKLEAEAGVRLEHAPRVPSLALRLALAAEGKVDIALASNGSHDWDVAAADVILREAGGALLDLEAQALAYNRPSLSRGPLFAGPPGLAGAAAAALSGLRR
jgi:myo-inositol-1(or 4)-monophosphatase